MRGYFCWYWWNCWPSFNELKWEVIFVDIGVIIDITQWVDVWGDFCWYWWNCLPSLNELRWGVIFVDIGGIVDHHSMSWSERWFLLMFVELLTITQWVEVRGDFCWYWWNCWPSLNELKWDVILVDIGGIVDHHSMSLGERWFLLILVELMTITQWVEVRDDFCWYWWNCWPSLTELRWEVIFVDIGGIVDNHSMSWIEGWFFYIGGGIIAHHSMRWSERWCLLMFVELLTITQWVEVRGDFCWYWWNCWPSLNELKW
jgi:hypothetical protein